MLMCVNTRRKIRHVDTIHTTRERIHIFFQNRTKVISGCPRALRSQNPVSVYIRCWYIVMRSGFPRASRSQNTVDNKLSKYYFVRKKIRTKKSRYTKQAWKIQFSMVILTLYYLNCNIDSPTDTRWSAKPGPILVES